MRDNSKFSRQGSNFRDRQNSKARSGNFVKQGGTSRCQSKSQERPSEMFTKVENLEKEFEKFKKFQNEIKEILKKQTDKYTVCRRRNCD